MKGLMWAGKVLVLAISLLLCGCGSSASEKYLVKVEPIPEESVVQNRSAEEKVLEAEGEDTEEDAASKDLYSEDERQASEGATVSEGPISDVEATDEEKTADGAIVDKGLAAEEEALDETNTADGDEEAIRELVNSLSLCPKTSGYAKLDRKIEEIMPGIIGESADTYDKVKACYSYLIENCRYSPTTKYSYEEDAYILLDTFQGSCTYYVAALHYMLQYLGVENTIINGYRYPVPNEQASFHRWIEIKMNGTSYILDPQWEDSLYGRRYDKYTRFFVTHEQMKGNYQF